MIPNNPTISYIALLALTSGLFLLLTSLNLINITNIKVSKTKTVKIIGSALIIFGSLFLVLSIDNNPSKQGLIIQNPIETEAYNYQYTHKKKGLLIVDKNWKKVWLKYFTYYKNFVVLPTEKGYYIYNSPNKHSYFASKEDKSVEVSGYIRTDKGIFYVTKYSFEMKEKEGYPKFLAPIK